MKNNNQWLSHRGYLQHLQALKKISSRKIIIRQKITHSKHPTNTHQHHDDDSQNKQKCIPYNQFQLNLAERERQLLWENYNIGKRIIQTSAVISRDKLEQDFQKHKRLVQCLTSSSNRNIMKNDFRVKKLQEFKQNLQKKNDKRWLKTTSAHNLIKIKLNHLSFYRFSPTLDNLILNFTYTNKQGKISKQNTPKFNAQNIMTQYFYFQISKRLISNQEALSIQICNIKGLNQQSIGHFTFPSSENLLKYQSQIFHYGKIIGEVQIQTSYIKDGRQYKIVKDMSM